MAEHDSKLASAASQISHPLPREGGWWEPEGRDHPKRWGKGQSPRGSTTDDGHQSVAIVGGGPVGMALALALAGRGIRAAIHDDRPRGAARHDKRIIALSHGSRQILEWLGVWQAIAATPIKTIHVSQQGGFGRTRITAEEQGVPALGYVATAASLSAALDGVRPPTAPAANSAAPEGATLTQGDGLRLSADAELMRTALEQVQGALPIRQDVVERTKAALARGDIGNDAHRLADALIDSWLTAAP